VSSCPLCPPGDAEGAGRPVVVLLLFFTRVLPRVWASAASTNLGQDPPEIAYWERGEWWLVGGRSQAVATGGGDCRQRSVGGQAVIDSDDMMLMRQENRPACPNRS
jgi:hypothetical protein